MMQGQGQNMPQSVNSFHKTLDRAIQCFSFYRCFFSGTWSRQSMGKRAGIYIFVYF